VRRAAPRGEVKELPAPKPRESTLREISRVARRVPWVGRFLNAAERLDLSTGNLGAARERFGRYLGERAASEENRSPAPPSSRRMAVAPVVTAGVASTHVAVANDAGRQAPERGVVFLAHFLEPSDLRAWDRSLASLSAAECALLLERSRTVLQPFITYRGVVQSVHGSEVGLTVVAIPFTSAQVMASFRQADSTWVREMIEKAVEIAREQRAAVIGFGGYTSIMTNNCEDVLEEAAILTSGNSVTAAAAVDATLAAVERAGLPRVDLGVVGAVGNIGTVLAELFAEHVSSILLVGRRPAKQRLEHRADELYASAWQQALDGQRGGVPGALWRSGAVRAAAADGSAASLGARLRKAHLEELGEDAVPIRVATEMGALVACNAIVSATNSPKHVVFAKHVAARGPVVLCDVATPGDISPEIARERPNAILLKGGIVRLPLGQHLAIDGMQLPTGQIYGCLAETVLLGLTGAEESLSLGALSAEKVRCARSLAHAHGFEFTKRAFECAPPSSPLIKEAAWSSR
jgi:predicted amino acid dehydrogenase